MATNKLVDHLSRVSLELQNNIAGYLDSQSANSLSSTSRYFRSVELFRQNISRQTNTVPMATNNAISRLSALPRKLQDQIVGHLDYPSAISLAATSHHYKEVVGPVEVVSDDQKRVFLRYAQLYYPQNKNTISCLTCYRLKKRDEFPSSIYLRSNGQSCSACGPIKGDLDPPRSLGLWDRVVYKCSLCFGHRFNSLTSPCGQCDSCTCNCVPCDTLCERCQPGLMYAIGRSTIEHRRMVETRESAKAHMSLITWAEFQKLWKPGKSMTCEESRIYEVTLQDDGHYR